MSHQHDKHKGDTGVRSCTCVCVCVCVCVNLKCISLTTQNSEGVRYSARNPLASYFVHTEQDTTLLATYGGHWRPPSHEAIV